MTIPQDEKIKNWYNALRKNKLGDEARPSHVPQEPNVQMGEIQRGATAQDNIVSSRNMLKHDPVVESSRKFKVDPLCKGSIEAEQQ